MERVEIRQVKKVLMPFLIISLILFFVCGYFTFSDYLKGNIIVLIIQIGLSIYFLITVFNNLRKLMSNTPILIFEKDQLIINLYWRPIYISWTEIVAWDIEKDDDNGTPYLLIELNNSKKKFNIGWLEKTPEQIDELMKSFLELSLHNKHNE